MRSALGNGDMSWGHLPRMAEFGGPIAGRGIGSGPQGLNTLGKLGSDLRWGHNRFRGVLDFVGWAPAGGFQVQSGLSVGVGLWCQIRDFKGNWVRSGHRAGVVAKGGQGLCWDCSCFRVGSP